MARYLYVLNNTITNIVEAGNQIPPLVGQNGEDIVAAVTGLESVGDAFNAATGVALRARTPASTQLSQVDAIGMLFRAEASVLVSEINILREWIVSFQAAVAAATTLANLKTGVAALPTLSDRTLLQARTAILNAINSGVDDA